MKQSTFFLFLVSFLFSCQSQNNQNIPSEIIQQNSLVKKINFYAFDSIFQPYFPDTTLDFENLNELSDYSMGQQNSFKMFSDSMKQKVNYIDSIILSTNSAEREFYRLLEILYFRQIKKFPKNNVNMAFLSYLESYNGVDIKERARFFNSYPETIRNNEIGQKTWNRINEYLFDKNIGKSTNQFSTLQLANSNDSISFFSEVINDRHQYYILVFGASWCLPCRVDEKQLKYWLPAIDTSKIKIIGLSIDIKKKEWLKYLKEESFPWACYLLRDGWQNSFLTSLNFNSVPMNFLVSKNGNIIKQDADIRGILNYLSNLI